MRAAGFTLIELLVVIAITGLLFGLYSIFPRDGMTVRSAAESLSSNFSRARMEALRRNEYMGVRVDPAANTFFLFMDVDRNLQYTLAGDGQPITQVGINSGEYSLVKYDATVPSTGYTFVFDTRGLSRTPTGFAVKLTNRSGSVARTVQVSAQGRSNIQ